MTPTQSAHHALPRSAVILAGGAGERFWPLSRLRKPKQLLSIQGSQSMLLDSLDRISGLIDPADTFIVTGADLRDAIVEEIAGRIPSENILAEPARRNTALALALAAARLQNHFQGRDTVTAVLTADHAIRDSAAFTDDLNHAIQHAELSSDLVTFGIPPTRPETGFGYIETGEPIGLDRNRLCRVQSFREKPSPQTAEEFLETGRFLWNSGMFVWRNHRLLEQFSTHLPRTAEAAEMMRTAIAAQDQIAFEKAFLHGDAMSIDYGIMERCRTVAVVRASFDWDDVGTWSSVARLLPRDQSGNAVHGEAIALDCENTLIYGHTGTPEGSRPRVLVGYRLEDLVVVDTEDAVLILPMDHVQGVKEVVAHLRKAGRTDWL
jgi:mannose-1-phosphate guanylyltransferase